MTNEECAKALEDLQRRAVRHQNTGGPILLAGVPADPETLRTLGYYVPEPRPVQQPEAVR
jgi:hypothetical protein